MLAKIVETNHGHYEGQIKAKIVETSPVPPSQC
jgi:hypothetical protein